MSESNTGNRFVNPYRIVRAGVAMTALMIDVMGGARSAIAEPGPIGYDAALGIAVRADCIAGEVTVTNDHGGNLDTSGTYVTGQVNGLPIEPSENTKIGSGDNFEIKFNSTNTASLKPNAPIEAYIVVDDNAGYIGLFAQCVPDTQPVVPEVIPLTNPSPEELGGYRLAAEDGGTFAYGAAEYIGSEADKTLNAPIVGAVNSLSGKGQLHVTEDGMVFASGDAKGYGSLNKYQLGNRKIVGIDRQPNGDGYWLVVSDGEVFSFGGAKVIETKGTTALNKPIVGMSATPTGEGFWLVASDGGVFAYGDAKFYGSTGGITLNKPIVGIKRTPSGDGYTLVASDGGIFAYGDAQFYGSTGGITLNKPIVGMDTVKSKTGSNNDGYYLVSSDGGVFTFGNLRFYGSTGGIALNKPIVALNALQ